MKLTLSEAAKLPGYSPRELESIAHALTYGCLWHGLLLSPGCCECDMIRFYREQVGREAHP